MHPEYGAVKFYEAFWALVLGTFILSRSLHAIVGAVLYGVAASCSQGQT